MRIKLTLLLIAVALSVGVVRAQQKHADVWKKSVTVKSFKSSMKEKNYAKAKSDIDGAIKKYADAATDPELYSLKANALNELIVAENRKIYLKQNPDTIKYFNYIYELYDNGLICDIKEQALITEKANKGKKQSPVYRYNVGQKMQSYRKNLLQAGKYFYKKQDYTNAYKFLDIYLVTKNSAVLTDKKNQPLAVDDDDVTSISSLATLSAYAIKNYSGVLKYVNEALCDSSTRNYLLEIASVSAIELKDTVSMLHYLEEGFDSYVDNDFFFVTLVKYYNSTNQHSVSLEHATRMTKVRPNQRDYWFVKGKIEMLTGDYSSAILSFNKCVEIKADDAEAYSSLGNIHLYYAHDKYNQLNISQNDPDYNKMKLEINNEYNLSCENFEMAKKYDEQHAELWLDGLRETYFKLNKGKELKKLDKYK